MVQEDQVTQAVHFLPDVLRMFSGVLRDPRVPAAVKLQSAGLIALGLTPLDAVPLLGQLEMLAATTLAARHLVKRTDEAVLREHWSGTDEGFRVVLALVEAGARPLPLLWRLARRGGR